MHKILLVLLCFSLVLSGCKTLEQNLAEQGYRELRGDELSSQVSGSTVYADRWQDAYSADGKMSGSASSGSYTGTWKINKDGKLCISSMNQYIDGCARVFVHKDSGQVKWYEADGRAYPVTISK